MAEFEEEKSQSSSRESGEPPQLDVHLRSEWLEVTLYSIGDAVIAIDRKSRVTFMNPVAEQLTGWSSAEGVGQPLDKLFRIIHESDRSSVEAPTDRALRNGEIAKLSNHTLLIARDGSQCPISESAAPIRNQDGEIVGAVLVFRDMTEQRERDREIQDARDYTENIIDTLRHPFLVLDENLCVLSSNRAFYRHFQVAPDTTKTRRLYNLGNGQWDIPRLRELLEEIIPHNSSFEDFEVEHDFPQLGHRCIILNARRINREHGPDLILLGMEDVTQQRQAELARQELETRFTSLVKNIRDHAIFTVTPQGRIATWNIEAERILGYREDEAIGKDFSLIFTAEDIADGRPEEELTTAIETGRAEDERWHRRKDGELFWALGIVTPMTDAAGNHTGFSKILRDITDRKKAELALKDAHRRKDEFLATLSHELRNPLAPILNAVQLMGQGNIDEADRRTAEQVIELQVRHLKRLVDDLLEISRITSGRIRLQQETVVLQELIRRSVERTSPHIDERKQELLLELPDNDVLFHGDAARLEQVFGNLINNASKYNDAGGKITVSLDLQGEHALVSVRDNGHGIDDSLLPHIFNLFTQADKSLDRSEGGLGIGLALVKNLVQMHQGEVEVHSDGSGKGSEFRVRLPIAKGVEPQPPRDTTAQDHAVATSLRLLVVDDNLGAAKVTAMLLRSWGHEVTIAHSGTDALQQAIETLPQAIFLDIGLPKMDGYEVARHIRQHDQLKDTYLVAMTGYGKEEDRARSKEAGFDQHLIKPVEASVLKELLAEVAKTP